MMFDGTNALVSRNLELECYGKGALRASNVRLVDTSTSWIKAVDLKL